MYFVDRRPHTDYKRERKRREVNGLHIIEDRLSNVCSIKGSKGQNIRSSWMVPTFSDFCGNFDNETYVGLFFNYILKGAHLWATDNDSTTGQYTN